MLRQACHLLLSLALIFQGMAVACAAGDAQGRGHAHAHGAATAATHCAHAGCGKCTDGQGGSGKGKSAAGGCMHSCSMPANLPDLALLMASSIAPAALSPAPARSLLERVQVPPTPPPIA